MIFKTINDKFIILGKTTNELWKSLNKTSEKFSEFCSKLQDGNIFGTDGAFATLFRRESRDIITPEIENEFNQLNNLFGNSSLSIEDCAESLNITNRAMIRYIGSCQRGTADIEGFREHIDRTSFSLKNLKQIGLQVAATIGNMFLGFVIAKGLEWLTKEIDEAITTTEEYKEKLSELKSEVSDFESELSSLNTELETTRERMSELEAKGTLSFTEFQKLMMH